MYDVDESAEQEFEHDPNELAKKQRLINCVAIAIGLISICIGIGALVWEWDVIRDQRQGPMTLTAADLAAAPKLSALPANWVTLNATKVRDTGVRRDLVANNGARYTTYKYSLAVLDGRQLIIESYPSDRLRSPVTGHLVQWGMDDDIVAEIRAKDPECRDADLLRFQLVTHLGQNAELAWLLAGVGVAVVFGLVMLGAGLVGMRKTSVPPPAMWPPQLIVRAAGRR